MSILVKPLYQGFKVRGYVKSLNVFIQRYILSSLPMGQGSIGLAQAIHWAGPGLLGRPGL